MRSFILAISLALTSSAALAADLPLPVKAPSLFGAPCVVSPLSCTGFYTGVFLDGVATNLDIIGSGIGNSVFASGAIPGVTVGWQYALGSLYFAAEAGIGDQISTSANIGGVSGNQNGLFGYQEVQAGLALAGLLDTAGAVAPAVPSALTGRVIAPFGIIGIAERPFGNGLIGGAGIKFDFTTHVIGAIKYEYVNYSGGVTVNNAKFTNENLVALQVLYKF